MPRPPTHVMQLTLPRTAKQNVTKKRSGQPQPVAAKTRGHSAALCSGTLALPPGPPLRGVRDHVSGLRLDWYSTRPGRLAEPVDELVGMPADGFVEHLVGVRVPGVAQRVALAVELEAGSLHFLLHQHRIDAMQRVGIARAGTRG